VHHLGAIAQKGERLLCKQDVVGSIPSGSTKFSDKSSNIFPSSHLGEGCRLLTGEGRFETCGGSHFRTRFSCLCLLAARNLPSQGGNTGSNPVGGSNPHVAQLDERDITDVVDAGSSPVVGSTSSIT
jgi:hypothetical protein